MESLSYPMCVQLSSQAVDMWPAAAIEAVCLGERPVKGKGTMTTYLLKASRAQYVSKTSG
jgi:hypothetical protein